MKLTSGTSLQIVFKADWGNRLPLAAIDLRDHLALVGITATFAESPTAGQPQILLGSGWNAAADCEAATLNYDGVLLRTLDEQTLLLTGATTRGTQNAIYVFLEEHLGFLWFNPHETHIPSGPEWDFTGLEHRYEPPFALRFITTASSLDATWSARKRLNFLIDSEVDIDKDPRLIDCTTFAGKHCHNVYKLLSLGYFGTRENPGTPYEDRELILELYRLHPEYFALIGGSRHPYPGLDPGPDQSDQSGNISLTHPEIPGILVRGMRLLLQHYPRARLISFSLRDNYDYCEEALAAPGGVSGALVRLVNRIAPEIEESHPHVRIDFLAYHGTQRPPVGVKFHPNISVRYCPIRVSQYHAFDESEHNLKGGMNYETPPSLSRPIEQITEWSRIASRVVVWYYTLNLPFLHPHPSLRAHGRNLRLMEELGVHGVYIQDNQPIAENSFNDLRAHLLSSLLWNPRFDESRGMRDFCHAYYGEAAGPILAYISLLHTESMWDWQQWPTQSGLSKWDSNDREISWHWFGEEPDADYPKPHFYTLYHTRPPLKPEFFSAAWPLIHAAQQAGADCPEAAAHLSEVITSFYYGVLSNCTGIPELDEEAQARFPALYDAILHQYRGQEFYGLDRYGLTPPRPLLEV